MFPRLFTNTTEKCVPNGTIAQNGVGKMNEITDKVLAGIKELGVTAVWYTGIIEHATKTDYTDKGIVPADNPHVVKGEAGSPYAIKDYYDVDPDLAVDVDNRMGEFEELVARTHDAGLEVIIDFVPNHTARCYHSDAAPAGIEDFGAHDDADMFFSPNNNYYYITRQLFAPSIDLGSGKKAYVEFPAKATGDDCFSAFPGVNNWYETVKLNYGIDYGDGSCHFDPVPSTWLKMLNILRFWASKGIDGFRCDMVFMVPVAFWHWVIPQVKKDYPHIIFIGEIYDIGQYREFLSYGCFDYLYDKVNLYDTLVAIEKYNCSAAQLTGCWQSIDGIAPHMLNFLENHDEVRFGSEEYAGSPSKALPYLVVSSMINTGPFMIYYGQELGECATDNEGFAGNNHRTTIFDYWSLDTLRRWYNHGTPDSSLLSPKEIWLRKLYQRLLTLCNKEKAISEGSFFDLMYVNLNNPHFNPHSNFAFLRHHGKETLLIAVNFSGTDTEININIPQAAFSMMEMPVGEGICEELISGSKCAKRLLIEKPFVTKVKAYGAVIWKIRHNAIKPLSEQSL